MLAAAAAVVSSAVHCRLAAFGCIASPWQQPNRNVVSAKTYSNATGLLHVIPSGAAMAGDSSSSAAAAALQQLLLPALHLLNEPPA
jgi:hypothetical protein